jgi:hypothetical protein
MNNWYEIWHQTLAASKNAHIAVRGQMTLRQAFSILKSPQMNGADWWHLVIHKADGTWIAGRFVDLVTEAERRNELDARLDELDWLPVVASVDLTTIGVGEAKDIARRTREQVLVVTEAETLAGILYVGTQLGGEQAISTSALTQLSGDYADLKEFSGLLLESEAQKRPKQAKRGKT